MLIGSSLDEGMPDISDDNASRRLRERRQNKPIIRYEEEFPLIYSGPKCKKRKRSKVKTSEENVEQGSPTDVVTKLYKNWEKAPRYVRSVGLSGDKNVYEVEKILGRRKVKEGGKDVIQYLVKWQGWGPMWNGWEPACNLSGCRTLILAYNQQQKIKQDKKPGWRTAYKAANKNPASNITKICKSQKKNGAAQIAKKDNGEKKKILYSTVHRFASKDARFPIEVKEGSDLNNEKLIWLEFEDQKIEKWELTKARTEWPIRIKTLLQMYGFQDWI